MAGSKDYKIERWGAEDAQRASQPMGANVVVAGGAIAVTDGTTGLIKDAAGTTSATDLVWGLIHTRTTASSVSASTYIEIETGQFFLPSDVAFTQASIGATVYLSGEQQVSLSSSGGTRATVGKLVYIDTAQYGGNAISVGSNRGTP